MALLIIIILLGIVFVQNRKIESLNVKIFTLQKELKKIRNSTKTDNDQNSNVENVVNNVVQEKIESIPKTVQVQSTKPKADPVATRNLSILITGSILIVLAAIVFLTTAWQTTPDFIKTIVLFLVAFVFIGASKISKEKYNLEKASKTFFYIGMAYLPICLLSISIFGLFGTYLSASGEGKYIYLGFSTLILAVLYYYVSKVSKDKYLFYGSMLSQIFSVILLTLMFEERFFLVCINLLLYNILLMLLTKDKLFELVEYILPVTIAVAVVSQIGDGSWYFIFASLLLAVNFMFLEYKKSSIVKAAAFNSFLFVFGYSLIFKDSFQFSDGTCQVLAIVYTGIVFVAENLFFSSMKENKNLLITTRVITLISSGYIYAGSFFEASEMTIPSYVVGLLIEILLIINLKSSKNYVYKYLAYGFTNILLFDIHNNFFENKDLFAYIPMLTTSVIMFYEMYSVKRDDILPIYLAGLQVISLILVATIGTEVSVVLAIIFTIFAIYYNKKTGTVQVFNAVPLLSLLPSITYSNLNEQLELGILLLSTIGLTYLSVTANDITLYTFISGIYLVITSEKIDSDYFREILYIVWSAMHVYFYQEEKRKDVFKVLTAIFASALYYSAVEDLKLVEITLFELLGIVVAGMYIIKNVLPKYYKNVDALEYVFWGIIYMYALSNYTDSQDGIIFSILILSVIFYSYYQKYGATFLAGIIAILVNGFALTRAFWLSIPWWIYLLVVGGLLVGFAIRNEANENKEKLSVGSVLKEIKDKVEKE